MARKTSKSAADGDETGTTETAEGLEDNLDFETALEELEDLVVRMEAGDMSLDASLSAFERGVKLTRHCQTALRSAELKVKKLTETNELEDLDLEELDDD